MARIAVVDHVEALRAEEDVDVGVANKESYADIAEKGGEEAVKPNSKSGKCIATVKQVHDAFDSFTTLRYSQPTHLQGQSICCSYCRYTYGTTPCPQESAKV